MWSCKFSDSENDVDLILSLAGVTADLDPRGFGHLGPYLLADLDPPGSNPLVDMDPPSQIWSPWTPLPNFPFKHPLYHIW